MPICGLLLTLDPSEPHSEQGLLQLKTDQRITFGDPVTPHLIPVVLEAKTPSEAQKTTEWIQTIQGVQEVNVISVDFETDRLSSE